MLIEIDGNSGFCFGVRNAIQIAESALRINSSVYSLGAIVHNDKEIERMSALGLKSISYDDFDKLGNCNLLIRAHGEPPQTYTAAAARNISIVDATCPIVKKLQEKIRRIWEETKDTGSQIVIFGKKGHAEVIGLLGQTDNRGILVSDVDDLKKLNLQKPIFLFSQTTMSVARYDEIKQKITALMRDNGADLNNFHVFNTICSQVSNREPLLKAFAAKYDVILFVSGKESSNGKMLFSVCKSINRNTYFISLYDEIDYNWFTDKQSIGICGATSTPKWLIEEVFRVLDEKLNG